MHDPPEIAPPAAVSLAIALHEPLEAQHLDRQLVIGARCVDRRLEPALNALLLDRIAEASRTVPPQARQAPHQQETGELGRRDEAPLLQPRAEPAPGPFRSKHSPR